VAARSLPRIALAREVSVPLWCSSWLCETGLAPRLRGRAPLGRQAEFEAGAIELGDDYEAHLARAFSTLGAQHVLFPPVQFAPRTHGGGLPLGPFARRRFSPCLSCLSCSVVGAFRVRSRAVRCAHAVFAGLGRCARRRPRFLMLWAALSWPRTKRTAFRSPTCLAGSRFTALLFLLGALGLALGHVTGVSAAAFFKALTEALALISEKTIQDGLGEFHC